jgi:hypothetical protein
MEVNSKLHKIDNVIEPMPEMKRELANNAISLISKASGNQLEILEERIENEYTSIKQFLQLQHSVSNKAEW